MDLPSTRASASFASYQTAGGARIFRLPMNGFPGFWVYAYLILLDSFVVLIDSGTGFGESNANLEAGFEQASREAEQIVRMDDLTHILITHGHIDHFGGLNFLREHTQAPICIHELDLGILVNYEERVAVAEKRLGDYLLEAGVVPEKLQGILDLYRFNKPLFRSVPVQVTCESQGMGIGPFEMLHVPGHCAGQVVIRLHDVLFSGDHVLAGISPHQWPERLTPYTGLSHYLESLNLLRGWAGGVKLTLPGHNNPIEDLPARIREIRGMHSERLASTLDFLNEPHNITEVSRHLFGKVSGYNVLLAIEEAGAHVEYLHQHGYVHIANLQEFEAHNGPVAVLYQSMAGSGRRPLLVP